MQSISPTNLVWQALQKLGAYPYDLAPPSGEITAGITVANQLIDNWRTQSLTIPVTVRETFSLIINQQTYTIGVGGDFNTERPMAIDAASIQIAPGGTPPYEIGMGQLNWEGYIGITIKTLPNPFPVNFYYNPTFQGGLGQIFVWPLPNQVYTIVLYTQRPLSELDATHPTTDVIMPPGYVRALVNNLAQEFIPTYGRNQANAAIQLVIETAQKSLADIKRQNTAVTVQSTGLAGAMFGGPVGAYTFDFNWNILTGP